MTDWGLVNQARDSIGRLINENPEVITVARKLLVDNGFDVLVEDPSGASTPVEVRCRISHRNSGPFSLGLAPAGFSVDQARYILVDHRTVIVEGDTFGAIGNEWRIGPVDVLKRFGQTIGYQAPLIEANNTEVAT